MLISGLGYAVMGGGKYKDKLLSILPLPDNLNFEVYSSLMGLLATNGASLQLGFNWYWDYKTVFLRLSHPDPQFLWWLTNFFHSDVIDFIGKEQKPISTSNSKQVSSIPTNLCYILWLHWNEVGIHVLPVHFAHFFSIHTLAFWAMRNGQWSGQLFYIHVGRLNDQEKALLIALIQDKLGYSSKLAMNGNKLAIDNPAKLVLELKPLFHYTQLHRLVKK